MQHIGIGQSIIIKPPNYEHSHAFDEIANAFTEAMQEAWVHKKLLFGAHLLNIEVGRDCTIYQSEQITPKCEWLTPEYLNNLRTHEVWDYSPANVEALKKYDIKARFVPIRYMPSMTTIIQPPGQNIDVLFYGSTNKRRLKILDELSEKGLNVRRVFGVYGRERDELIARSKIVLNLHYYENGIFEIFRCAHLFANSKCVVSETGRDKELEALYAESAVFCETDQIVDTCLKYLRSDELRTFQEWLAFKSFKSPTLAEALK